MTYLMAAEKAHAALTSSAGASEDALAEASKWAKRLTEAAQIALENDRKTKSHRRTKVMLAVRNWTYDTGAQSPFRLDPSMKSFLEDTVEPSGRVLWAGVLLERLRLIQPQERPKSKVLWAGLLLKRLTLIQPQERPKSKISTGRQFPTDPGELVKDLIDPQKQLHLSYRVRFNLACYFAMLSIDPVIASAIPSSLSESDRDPSSLLDRAAHELEASVAGIYGRRLERLALWAWADPTLRPLRDSDRKRFTRIVGPRPRLPDDVKAKRGLAGLRVLGLKNAADLDKKLAIKEPSDLVAQGRTESGRKRIARILDQSPDLVQRWVGLSELLALPAIDVAYANLLDEAGVRSRSVLAAQVSASRLAKLFRSINEALDLVSRIPSEATIQEWIDSARDTEA